MSAPIGRSDTERAWPWLVLLMLAGFTVWTYGELRMAVSAAWQDTSGYLAHALYIAERGGLLGFLRECFNGTFPVTERHPLYMLMLAPFASRTAEFFYIAKVINVLNSLAILVSLVWMLTRRYGRWPALIAATLYALSESLVVAASHVDNEPQIVLCVLWAWWFLTQPARDDAQAWAGATSPPTAPIGMPGSTLRWALGGLFVGLAFLAKSPAILIGLGVVVAGLMYGRLKFLFSARLWAFVAVMGLVSSPLIVRNLIGFGTPFYEGMNSSITWIDSWADVGGDHSIMYYDRYGVMTIEKAGMPTAREYFQTHTAGQVAERLFKGLYTEITYVAPRSLGFTVPPRYRFKMLCGFVLLALAVAGWWMRRKSWEGVLLFCWSGAFLVFFGWDHMFPEIRYLAPLVPIWLAFAVHALWRPALLQLRPIVAQGLASAAVVAAILVAGVWTVWSGALTQPMPVMAVAPAYERLNDWLNRVIEPGDRIMLGPTREFHGLIWVIERPVNVVLTPDATNLADFDRYLRERKVRYLVMHPENIEGEGGRLKEALAPHFSVSPEGDIVAGQPLPGWTPVFTDPGTPRRFIVLTPVDADGVTHSLRREYSATHPFVLR